MTAVTKACGTGVSGTGARGRWDRLSPGSPGRGRYEYGQPLPTQVAGKIKAVSQAPRHGVQPRTDRRRNPGREAADKLIKKRV